MQRSLNVNVLKALGERFSLAQDELDEFVQQGSDRLRTAEIDGLEVWFLDDADKWFVRWYRERRGISQGRATKAVGYCSQTTMSNWENPDHPSVPPLSVVTRYRALVDDLADDEEEAA